MGKTISLLIQQYKAGSMLFVQLPYLITFLACNQMIKLRFEEYQTAEFYNTYTNTKSKSCGALRLTDCLTNYPRFGEV
jgi:sialic acid synthase SpsE